MRQLAMFSARGKRAGLFSLDGSQSSPGLTGWTRRRRLGACLGVLVVAAAAIAQQAHEGHTEWFDNAEQAVVRMFSEAMTAMMAGVPDQARVDLLAGQPVHNPTVGKMSGDAGVNGGAATYTIPIVVPPGRRGMQPELALSYSSRVGNGIAGMGWSLSGTSSIHRCPATLEQDGVIRPVELGSNDKLCLDGQRLVATSGNYGQPGAMYATEINSFSRIIQNGALSSAAAYFSVETKSGDILYYGLNSARVTPGGASVPMSWLIERKLDRVGNLMRYTYADYGDGEALLASILYTEFNGGDVGDRKVEFTYETRPAGAGANDQSSTFIAGGVIRQTQRLTKIVTKVAAQTVRDYRLAYTGVSQSTGRSLLRSVQECAYLAAVPSCRDPTRFTWQEGTPTFKFHKNPAVLAALGTTIGTFGAPRGDFNGDGTSEYTYRVPGSGGQYTTYLVTATPERDVGWSMALPTLPGALDTFDLDSASDFDLDGKVDLPSWQSGTLIIYFWRGPANATTFAQAFTQSWNTGIAQGDIFNFGLHAGDMDADGRADIVNFRANPGGGSSCAFVAEAFINRAPPGGVGMPTAMDKEGWACLASIPAVAPSNAREPETVARIDDINGDGLPDIWLNTPTDYYSDGPVISRVLLGRKGAAHSFQAISFGSFFPASDPFNSYESSRGLFSRWIDVNGDGLQDWVYASLDSGKWVLRLNRGTGLSQRIFLNSWAGTERFYSGGETVQHWTPRYAGRINSGDTDADGRDEILIPRRFASRVCTSIIRGCTGTPNIVIGPDDPEWESKIVGGQCEVFEVCPEDPATGWSEEGIIPLYLLGKGGLDQSSYLMDALHFVEIGPNQFEIRQVATNIINGFQRSGDLYGDGLTDSLTAARCRYSAPGACVYLPNLPVTSPGKYLNENFGPAGLLPDGQPAHLNPNGKTPLTPDMLAMVTDGMGVETVWTYYPLGSKAGRGAGETPFYQVPQDTASRYVDDRHIYFTSSMTVVSDMIQSDGRGDYRSWRYGYSEAMYHTRGRGFQGFRTIVEEDEAAGTRTTTTFHQKFPLTSQPESIVVNSLKRSGVDGPISKQVFGWRCNRAYRGDLTACTPPSGAASVKFPFLDRSEHFQYDAAIADNPLGGVPPQLSLRRDIAADDTTCEGALSPVSAYDDYGNLTARTVLTYDTPGTGSGFRAFVNVHCVRTRSQFAAADITSWWVDKLDSRNVTTSVTYTATHPLPTPSPQQVVRMAYTWNGNRTLATETVQSGVANQQRVTTYGYPGTNYGLPNSVAVAAFGDPNGTRTVSTTYSADGYFPQTVTNPLLHTATTLTRKEDGQPSQVTDANGLRTLFDYDAFGLAVTTKYRGATDGEMLAPDKHLIVAWCAVGGCVNNGTHFIRTIQDGTPSTTTVFDRLGRTVRQRSRLMDEQDAMVDTQYDAAGRVTQQSQPYRYGETIYWTQFPGYDVLGRVTQKIAPQANHDNRGDLKTSYSYSGRQTSIQVCGTADVGTANCLDLSRTTDSLGRYVETVDAKLGKTLFWYDGAGNALAIQDAKSTVIKAAYNEIGQRKSVEDPNQGTWSFTYNALGEVLGQTDARGITTSTTYDKLGRPQQTSATYDYDGIGSPDTVLDTFNYDPAYGKGLEGSHTRKLNGAVQRTVATTYDPLSRPLSRTYDNVTGTPGVFQSLTQDTSYDSYYGRPKAQGYGNAETLWLRYSKYGALIQESDAVTGADYRVVLATDARGNPTQEVLAGGNLSASRTYQPQTGQLRHLIYGNLSMPSLRRLDYAYDVFGNVSQQALNEGQNREFYYYDALHRLTEATRSNGGIAQYAYDAVGNFSSKSDFSTGNPGAYVYSGGSCGGGPNAVKSVALQAGGTRTYCYDANGNLTGDNAGLVMKYDHTQRPTQIIRGGITRTFQYDATGTRFRQSGSGESTMYFPGLERRYGPINDEKTYLGGSTVVMLTGTVRKVEYLLTDRLGSVDAVTDANGALIETRGYDAFGKPRTGTWANATPPRLGTTANTPHGFTGHEHLNTVEMIHMNGRVYDYNVGRFTGVDPVIQFPLNSQSLNPYSYILNNPLAATDPTGYACSTGTHITGSPTNSGPSCEGLGVSGGVSDANTVGHMNGRARPQKEGNGAQLQGQATQKGKSATELNEARNRSNTVARDDGFWRGAGKGLIDSGSEIVTGTIGLMGRVGVAIEPEYENFTPIPGSTPIFGGSEGDLGGGGYKFGHALGVAFSVLVPSRSLLGANARIGDGPVTFAAPAGATTAEIAQIRRYCDGCNQALNAGALSPTGRVSTSGALRNQASYEAARERIRAAAAGRPYGGHAGHVPDTTWMGVPYPYKWMDMSPRINQSLGSQAARYPVGYRPTKFRFGDQP